MLEKTQLDLALVDNISLLTINESKNYFSKLDVTSIGSKVTDLHLALSKVTPVKVSC